MVVEEDVIMVDVECLIYWLVERVRQSFKENNFYEVKVWFIIVKILYFKDFGVQVSL